MLNTQTLQPEIVLEVDYHPLSSQKDITQRYRYGYDWFRGMKMDLLCFWEDDDWYSPQYLEIMAMEWIIAGKPDLFGINYSIYYHIKEFAYFKMVHYQRSPAMATFIRPDMNLTWCPDDEPYTDSHLWMCSGIKGLLVSPENIICMGIKHGVGVSGGKHHNNEMERYIYPDPEKTFLKEHLDNDSFKFYSNYFEK